MAVTYFKRYRMELALRADLFPAPPPPEGYTLQPFRYSLLHQHARAKYLSFRHEIDSQVFPCLGDLRGCQRLMEDISTKVGFVPRATWLATCERPRVDRRSLLEGPLSDHSDRSTADPASEAGYCGSGEFAYHRSPRYFPDEMPVIEPLTNRSAFTTASSASPEQAAQRTADLSSLDYCGTVQGIGDENQCGSIQNLGITPEHRGVGLGRCLLLKALEGFWLAGLRVASLEVTSQNEVAYEMYRRLGFRRVKTVYKAVDVAYSM